MLEWPVWQTLPVAEVERDGDVVALADRVDLLADRHDAARRLVAEDVPRHRVQPPPVPVALPGVPVAPADAAGLHGDDRAVWLRFRILDLADLQRFPVVVREHCCAHESDHGAIPLIRLPAGNSESLYL